VRYVHLPGAAVDTALLEDGKCSAYWTEDGMLTGDSDTERGCSAGFKGKVSVNWEHGILSLQPGRARGHAWTARYEARGGAMRVRLCRAFQYFLAMESDLCS
jgi:hypothetical protein